MKLSKKSFRAAGSAMVLFFTCVQWAAAQAFPVNIQVDQEISCNGAADGVLTASASIPGSGNVFTFLWSTGATTATVEGLEAGVYIVTVMDAAGSSSIGTAVVAEPPALTVETLISGSITCFNPSVSVAAQVSGGTAPYFFFWVSGQVDSVFTVTSGGVQTVVVTDQHGCQQTATATVPEQTEQPVTAGVDSVVLYCQEGFEVIERVCTNSTAVGYQWFAPDGQSIPGANNPALEVDSAGWFSVQVTNFANGCVGVDSVMVLADFLTVIPETPTAVYVDSINILSWGGVAPYQFVWTTTTGIFQSNAQDLKDAPPGFYVLTTTDAAGCSTVTGPFELQNTSGVADGVIPGLAVFPNPAQGVFQINWPGDSEMEMTAINAVGQVTSIQRWTGAYKTVDISQWPAGAYVLHLQTKTGVAAIRLICQ